MTTSLKQFGITAACCCALLLSACAEDKADKAEQSPKVTIDKNPFPSQYTPLPGAPTVITGVTILDGIGNKIDNGMVYFTNGKIAAIGENLDIPAEATVVDGTGKWVTPGIIDVHSHLGVYPNPSTHSHSDGNEAIKPVTANVWAEHSVWPQDPGFGRALAGGVTALQILPGSANLFGGRSVVLKNNPAYHLTDLTLHRRNYA